LWVCRVFKVRVLGCGVGGAVVVGWLVFGVGVGVGSVLVGGWGVVGVWIFFFLFSGRGVVLYLCRWCGSVGGGLCGSLWGGVYRGGVVFSSGVGVGGYVGVAAF